MSEEQSEVKVAEIEVPASPNQSRSLSRLPADNDLLLTPLMDVATAQSRLEELQKFVKMYLHEEEDYGKIPGTPKPTLYKPGADKLCDIYGLADTYVVTNRTEDWDKSLFDYEVECRLISKRTGQLVSTGMGSCNSYEGKYRWREDKRKCPKCGKETIIKGRADFGGGWVCWNKPGKADGCGAKFPDGDQSIEGQKTGKTLNEDIPTLKNTFLKMAKKRAKVDAVLAATRSSGIFTQDVEDIVPQENGSKEAAKAVGEQRVAEMKAKVDGQAQNRPTDSVAPHKANPESIGDIVKGFLRRKGVHEKLTKGKQKYLSVDVALEDGSELTMQCFDNKEFPDNSTTFGLLEMAAELTKPVPVRFRVKRNGKYVNIIQPELIFKTEFDESGVPIIQRDEPPPITDDDLPEAMFR